MPGWEVLSTATGTATQANQLEHCELAGVEPFLFMFPRFKSDVKGV